MASPRLIISALRGGSGKTILSVGIIAALRHRQHHIAPFKKGPDYIDAGWLALAAGRPCYNLDTFMLPLNAVYTSFSTHRTFNETAVIEGNRGLYDGIDPQGSTSTAELAKFLDSPVILCLDATKTTRTLAAVVGGCRQFDPQVPIKGVILNRVAGSRHEAILRQSIETHCRIPVIGAVPKLEDQGFPERHMGLVPTAEHDWAGEAVERIGAVAARHVDLDAVIQTAAGAGDLPPPPAAAAEPAGRRPTADGDRPQQPVTIGVIRDSAFQFYYPENFDALRDAGARLEFISPLVSSTLPAVDALYIGGGFPETHAEKLAGNTLFSSHLKQLAEGGLPIYAECGGLIYLGQELVFNETIYPMVGVLPITYGFSKKPQGHGYTRVRVEHPNPFYTVGTQLRGHEFHYSRVLAWRGRDADLAFGMQRGKGIVARRDGACYKNLLATYTHIHALGTPDWAAAMVRAARNYQKQSRGLH